MISCKNSQNSILSLKVSFWTLPRASRSLKDIKFGWPCAYKSGIKMLKKLKDLTDTLFIFHVFKKKLLLSTAVIDRCKMAILRNRHLI